MFVFNWGVTGTMVTLSGVQCKIGCSCMLQNDYRSSPFNSWCCTRSQNCFLVMRLARLFNEKFHEGICIWIERWKICKMSALRTVPVVEPPCANFGKVRIAGCVCVYKSTWKGTHISINEHYIQLGVEGMERGSVTRSWWSRLDPNYRRSWMPSVKEFGLDSAGS